MYNTHYGQYTQNKWQRICKYYLLHKSICKSWKINHYGLNIFFSKRIINQFRSFLQMSWFLIQLLHLKGWTGEGWCYCFKWLVTLLNGSRKLHNYQYLLKTPQLPHYELPSESLSLSSSRISVLHKDFHHREETHFKTTALLALLHNYLPAKRWCQWVLCYSCCSECSRSNVSALLHW